MRSLTPLAAFSIGLALFSASVSQAQPPSARGGSGKPPSIEDKTASMKKMDGYFPTYWMKPKASSISK